MRASARVLLIVDGLLQAKTQIEELIWDIPLPADP